LSEYSITFWIVSLARSAKGTGRRRRLAGNCKNQGDDSALKQKQDLNVMAVQNAKKRICEAAGSWNGVTLAPHRFGGTQFRLGNREIGHIHGDRLVDIPFPKAMRDRFVKNGDAEPHHIFPQSGWVSLFLRTEPDVERAIRLLRVSFESLKGKAGSE
jgi:hypothetical protein